MSAGRRYIGMEHWLPLYYESLETLFDYLPDAVVMLDHQAEEVRADRLASIADFYGARQDALKMKSTAPVYRPVRPEQLYLDEPEWAKRLAGRRTGQLTPLRCARGRGARRPSGRGTRP